MSQPRPNPRREPAAHSRPPSPRPRERRGLADLPRLARRPIDRLGELVGREVSAYRRRLAQRSDAAAAEVLAALHASRELQAELATIVEHLERLAGGRKQRERE